MGSLFHPAPAVSFEVVRHVVGLVRKVAATFRGLGGAPSTTADPTCDRLAGLDRIPQIVRGFVVRSGIGSYDCEVSVDGRYTVVCSSLAPVLSDIYGVSQSCMPAPGTCVLVYVEPAGLGQGRPMRGFILGVVPDAMPHGLASDSGETVHKAADVEYPEGGVAQFTESGPTAIASDKEFPYRGEFQCGRPHDVVPGEYALTNHAGSGLVIGALSTTVKGSELASVRCSALDNQVRVTSGHFRHINAAGSDEIFNDGGYITVESFVSMYQPERLGVKSARPAFSWSATDPLEAGERRSGVTPMRSSQTAKKRMYRYSGYLGDIVNVFVASPDPQSDVEEMADPSVDRGLLHYHVDSSGRFTMRSASGIMLERYDRIPVPKRRHYAWDPAGDNAEAAPADKRPFEVKDDPPMGIGLTLGDMAAWWNSQAYSRFLQFGDDFAIPGQDELPCPDEDYDPLGKGRGKFKAYDLRHSYMGLTPNGGIVLRDAWGSEIIMADGRITLNAAANIEVRSGSTVVILGGDDVVAKAYNSVDISATKKDVRVKAENNLQVVSMKRGVLIQSKSEHDTDPKAWDATGEDLVSGGVVIKADASTVAVVGRRTEMQGADGINIASFDKDRPSGNVVIAGRQVSSVASDNVIATAQGTSGLVISGQSALLCAPSVLNVGGQSVADVAGNNMMLGIPVDAESMYSSLIAICQNQSQRYLDSIDWLYPFSPDIISQVDFRFRTTEQYGTSRDSGMAGGVFSVYAPSWAMLAEARRPLMNGCQTQAWDEGKDAAGGFPWPGAEAMQQNSYHTYREQNITEQGLEQVKAGEVELTAEPFSLYHIRRST